MKRASIGYLSFTLLLCISALAEGPLPASSIQGSVYTNDALGLSWEIPKGWVLQKVPTQPNHGRTAVLLQLSPSPNESVALAADDYQNSSGFHYHYSETLKEMLTKQNWEMFGSAGSRTVGGGIAAAENRFKSKDTPPHYLAVICGPLRGYEIKFLIESADPERLDEIEKSLVGVNVRPDWSSGEKTEPSPADNTKPRMVRVSQGVSIGLLKKKVQPEYPAEARRQHVQGMVVLLLHVDTLGRVQNLYAVEGNSLLIPAAVKAVSQWQYRPYLLNGEPIAVESQAVVNFGLN
jgi:TonB family protein